MNIEYDKNGNAINLVLIDTWWNVNKFLIRHVFDILSFNRYMVECESLSVLKSAQTVTAVLIDTWWNVNMEHYNEYIFQYQVLIDTWWNVNVCIGMIQSYGSNCFNRYMVECE